MGMPTTRRRHVVTETEEVARALNDAAERWPEERANRARLLVHLVEEGHRSLASGKEAEADRRRRAVSRTSGALTGVYGPSYMAELRQDWPA